MKKSRLMSRILGTAVALAMICSTVPLGAFGTHSQVGASPGTIYVPDDYSTIQAAVNASSPGDTIIVRDGTYTENVVVNKDHLTIESENGSTATAIQPISTGDDLIKIASDYVIVGGFALQGELGNSRSGISITSAHCEVRDNRVTGFTAYGIEVTGSGNNTLLGNVVSDCWFGISIRSDSNVLINNTVSNRQWGVEIINSSNNTFRANTILGDHVNFGLHGGMHTHFIQDIDESNKINDKPIYYWVNERDKKVPEDAGYVALVDSVNITVSHLDLAYNREGLLLVGSSNCNVQMVDIHNCWRGVVLYGGTNNVFTRNRIRDNGTDIEAPVVASSNNRFFLNDIIDDFIYTQTYDSPALWQSPSPLSYTYKGHTYTNYLGNHWSDYTGIDADGDGIGDTPYPTDSDPDNYPLMDPSANYPATPVPQLQWSRTFGGPGDDMGLSVEQTSDGGYILAGHTESYGAGLTDAYLIRTDQGGNEVWSKTFGGTGTDRATDVHKMPDGGYLLTGSTHSDAYLVRTDLNGNLTWVRAIGTLDNEVGHSSSLTSDGGCIIVGLSHSLGSGQDLAWLLKTNTAGNQEWVTRFGHGMQSGGSAVQQTSDGGHILVGYTRSSGQYDAWLIKTDGSGSRVWDQVLGGTGYEAGTSVLQTSDGGYVIAGATSSYGAGQKDFWLVKTDVDGNVTWNATYGGAMDDYSRGLQQTSDGGYLLVGCTYSYGAGNGDGWVIKTDSSGNLLWSEVFGGSERDIIHSIRETSDGGYIMIGKTQSYGAGAYDVWLLKLGSDAASPTVLSVSPENGQPDAAIDTTVTATFSEPMDSPTITTDSFTLVGSAISGTVTYDPGTYTATFTPDAALDYDHTYTATLSTAISGLAGNPLAAAYTWNFTTEPTPTPEQPTRPENLLPGDNSIDLSTMPILISSEFQHPDPQVIHVASHWRITTEPGNCNQPNLDWETQYALTMFVVPYDVLGHDATYYWQVRHKDEYEVWSDWSEETTFTTLKEPYADFEAIDKTSGHVLLDASSSESRHPDGELIFYSWAISEGDNIIHIIQETTQLNAWWLASGTYDVTLTIADDKGGISTTQQIVTVEASWFDRFVLILAKWLGYTGHGQQASITRSSLIPERFKWMFFSDWKKLGEIDDWLRYGEGERLDWTDADPEDIVYILNKEPEEGLKHLDFISIAAEQERMARQARRELGQACYHQGFPAISEFLENLGKEAAKSALKSVIMEYIGLPWEIQQMVKVVSIPTQLSGWEDMVTAMDQALYTRAFGRYILYRDSGNNPTLKSEWEAVAEAVLRAVSDDTVEISVEDLEAQFNDLYSFYSDLSWDFDKIRDDVKCLVHHLLEEYKDELPSKQKWYKRLIFWNPGELRFYDQDGNITGLVNGEITEEIEDSIFLPEDEAIAIYGPMEIARVEVVGTQTGHYSLSGFWRDSGVNTSFHVCDIPMIPAAVHQYTVDWNALSEGEEGVTVQIDSDGDGEFEDTFTSDEELTQDEFILQTETSVDFDPDTITPRNKGKVATAYIELPPGYDVGQIDVSSIRLNGTVPALDKPTKVGDHDDDSIPDLMLKFDMSAVQAAVDVGESVEIIITGEVGGIGFQGSDTIRVINP